MCGVEEGEEDKKLMLAKTARVCGHPPDALLSEDVL
jgi:hypothetical protein